MKTNAEKLQDAIAYLGKRWVLHPEYQTVARHSPYDRSSRPLRPLPN